MRKLIYLTRFCARPLLLRVCCHPFLSSRPVCVDHTLMSMLEYSGRKTVTVRDVIFSLNLVCWNHVTRLSLLTNACSSVVLSLDLTLPPSAGSEREFATSQTYSTMIPRFSVSCMPSGAYRCAIRVSLKCRRSKVLAFGVPAICYATLRRGEVTSD
jgi:hypothetical protein